MTGKVAGMGSPVSVLGTDLVVEKAWSRRPRILRDGRELPRDRWGAPVLTDEQGRDHQVRTGFSWGQLSPLVEVDGHEILALRPLSTPVRVALLAFIAVGFFGGAAGALLSSGAALASAALLRRPRKNVAHVLAAVLVPLAATALFALAASGLR
ncbi:hypothetical protein [Kineococcus glutinatus]|uniref:Uncharacterized protein n=1 Tax=Kineococcus glutinatus TaxID=1070872 RepID=A0ABP9HQ32_9ACTN